MNFRVSCPQRNIEDQHMELDIGADVCYRIRAHTLQMVLGSSLGQPGSSAAARSRAIVEHASAPANLHI